MKLTHLILFTVAGVVAAGAQTPAKPAVPAAKPATTTAKPGATAARSASASAAVKLPPGVPPAKGIVKSAFQVSLRYQDIKMGTGPVAEPKKLYKVHYTGWRAVDGVKFDSSYDHPGKPVLDKDGKPVMGADGKPKLSDPEPVPFPQGVGGMIVGVDQGLVGMRIGGKRRIFVPWQLAYGTRDLPARGPDHPGIPPKSDLIFDMELVDVADLPAPPTRPMMPRMPPRPGAPNGAVPQPGVPAPANAPKPAVVPPPAGAAPATPPVPTTPTPAPAAPSAAPAPSNPTQPK